MLFRSGLVVDAFEGEQEVTLKPMAIDSGIVNGAAILGDGEIALVLDIAGLLSTAANAPGFSRAAAPGASLETI